MKLPRWVAGYRENPAKDRDRAPGLAGLVLLQSAVVFTADIIFILLLVTAGPFIDEALLAGTVITYALGAFLMSPNR